MIEETEEIIYIKSLNLMQTLNKNKIEVGTLERGALGDINELVHKSFDYS